MPGINPRHQYDVIIVGFIDPNAPDEIAAPINPKLAEAAAEVENEADDESEEKKILKGRCEEG